MSAPAIATAFEAPHTHSQVTDFSRPRIWTGRILSGLVTVFFLMDAVMKLFKPPFVVQATLQLGYPESTIVGIGVALLVCTILYMVPRTAILGAVLLTGYLGGAVATHVRVGAPVFNIGFVFVFAGLAWVGLYLRDRSLQYIFAGDRVR